MALETVFPPVEDSLTARLMPFLVKLKYTIKYLGQGDKVNTSLAPQFFEQVRGEIDYLRENANLAAYELGNDRVFQGIKKRYSEHFCPCDFYHAMSLENQLEYLELRNNIDDSLNSIKSKYIYNDK
jgi:hypothetical protein